ncbi:MAG TPA: N-acetylmuramoyl-L-alanine amidase [Verrucomicrobiaceae bacterium]
MPHRRITLLLFFVLVLAVRAKAFDTVILDPGHGGHDRGAAIGNVYEKHLALDTARRVQQLLSGAGFKVVMTRDNDVFIPLEGRSAVGNKHSNAIFVSIHYNYNRSGSGHGIETYHCHDSSYRLAAYIQAYVIKESGLDNRGVKHANFHVIRVTTKNPAVLVECGFVSNKLERGAMVTGAYREKIAEGIAKGIIAYRRK